MTYRITLKLGGGGTKDRDTFNTEDRPDIVTMPHPDGRTVLRAIVGGRVVRRVIESIHRVEQTDEAGEFQPIEIDTLRQVSGKVNQIESGAGVNPPPGKPPRQAKPAAETPVGATDADPEGKNVGENGPVPEKLPAKKADLLALWEERHPGEDAPTAPSGNVTIASLTAALSAE